LWGQRGSFEEEQGEDICTEGATIRRAAEKGRPISGKKGGKVEALTVSPGEEKEGFLEHFDPHKTGHHSQKKKTGGAAPDNDA